jgi:hypothetical protein
MYLLVLLEVEVGAPTVQMPVRRARIETIVF